MQQACRRRVRRRQGGGGGGRGGGGGDGKRDYRLHGVAARAHMDCISRYVLLQARPPCVDCPTSACAAGLLRGWTAAGVCEGGYSSICSCNAGWNAPGQRGACNWRRRASAAPHWTAQAAPPSLNRSLPIAHPEQ